MDRRKLHSDPLVDKDSKKVNLESLSDVVQVEFAALIPRTTAVDQESELHHALLTAISGYKALTSP